MIGRRFVNAGLPASPYAVVPAGFNTRSQAVNDPSNGGAPGSFGYYLWIGANVSTLVPAPLIEFAHGSGEWGNTLSTLKNNGLPYVLQNSPSLYADCICLCPQLPNMTSWEGLYGPNPVHQFILDIHSISLALVLAECNVDRNRIPMTGYSVGGMHAAAMVYNFPSVYASLSMQEHRWQGNKLTPADSSTTDAGGRTLFAGAVTIPTRIYQNDNDGTATPSTNGRPLMAACGITAGGVFTTGGPNTTAPTYSGGVFTGSSANFTGYELTTAGYFNPPNTGGHDGIGPYEDAGVIAWMKAQTR